MEIYSVSLDLGHAVGRKDGLAGCEVPAALASASRHTV